MEGEFDDDELEPYTFDPDKELPEGRSWSEQPGQGGGPGAEPPPDSRSPNALRDATERATSDEGEPEFVKLVEDPCQGARGAPLPAKGVE